MYKVTSNVSAEIKRILDNLNVSTQTGLKNHVGNAGNHAVAIGAAAAHVITGHMRRNIQLQTVSPTEVKILAKAAYSGYENDRGPDHDFFQQMYDDTKMRYGGVVALGEIQKIMRGKTV